MVPYPIVPTLEFFKFSGKTVSTLGFIVIIISIFVVCIINSRLYCQPDINSHGATAFPLIRGSGTLLSSNERIWFQVWSFAENYLTEELKSQNLDWLLLVHQKDNCHFYFCSSSCFCYLSKLLGLLVGYFNRILSAWAGWY